MIRNFIFLFVPALFSAQCVIDEDAYGIDRNKHIIVINQNTGDLNAQVPGSKSYFVMGGISYYFDQAVGELQKGIAYSVTADNVSYKAFFSDLPIIRMTTTGTISDTPKVPGSLEMLNPGETKISTLIGVEYRGASSQSYPKKSMEVEFWQNENGDDTQDLSLLNLFEDDAVNLQAMYNEKLRINSKTANDLWQEIHPDVYYRNKEEDAHSGMVMKYTDLFLNGEYRGVYGVGEKVKRKFLKLKKYDNGIKGELYKGDSWDDAPHFNGLHPYDNSSDYWDGFEYKYPNEVIDWSNLYGLVEFVVNADEATFRSNYSSRIDVDNMLDYFIFMNLIRAVDNRGKNLYIAKYKKNEPYFYVPWDLDATYGSNWDGTNLNDYSDILFNGLYSRLWEDPAFRTKLSERWNVLRASSVTPEHINAMLVANYQSLQDNGVYLREKLVWTNFNATSSQLDYHKTWVQNRISYLDSVFGEYLSSNETGKGNITFSIFPNPANGYFSVQGVSSWKDAEISIIDVSGKTLLKNRFDESDPHPAIFVASLSSGIYFVIFKQGSMTKTFRLAVKR